MVRCGSAVGEDPRDAWAVRGDEGVDRVGVRGGKVAAFLLPADVDRNVEVAVPFHCRVRVRVEGEGRSDRTLVVGGGRALDRAEVLKEVRHRCQLGRTEACRCIGCTGNDAHRLSAFLPPLKHITTVSNR